MHTLRARKKQSWKDKLNTVGAVGGGNPVMGTEENPHTSSEFECPLALWPLPVSSASAIICLQSPDVMAPSLSAGSPTRADFTVS